MGISAANFSAVYGPEDLRIVKTAPVNCTATTTYSLTDEDGLPVVDETYSGGNASLYVIYGCGADGLRQIYYPANATYYSIGYDPHRSFHHP